jgi:prepilin-type processing-associated H-X9-DG protein
VSLAILVDVDNRSWQKMTTKWQEMGEHGELISLLLQSKNPELRYKHSTFGDKRYESLLNLIKEDKEENLLAGLKVYLNKWHSRHRNFWFHDGHLEDGPAYIGYWSYEAAAVAKIKGLDLTHTKLGEYFPYSFFGLPEQPKKTGKTKKVDLPKAESVISYPNFSRLTFDLADVWVNKSIQRLDLFTKDGKLECAGTVYNGDKDGFEDFIQSRHSSLLARMPWYQLVGGSTSVSLPVGQANKQLMQGTWEGDKDLTSYWVYSLCFGKYYLGFTFTFMAQEQTLHEQTIDDLLVSIKFEEKKR